MSVECQVNVKSQSELDIGGRETCFTLFSTTFAKLQFAAPARGGYKGFQEEIELETIHIYFE